MSSIHRTNFFMKENKSYSHVSFFLPVAYLVTVGVFFTETSKYVSSRYLPCSACIVV